MSKIKVQVSTKKASMLARDEIINTVYFDDFNVDPTGGTNWQAIADQVRNVFRDRPNLPGGYGATAKAYNMADAEPRPVKATAAFAISTTLTIASAPREVALCLSYYSERNLPRFRGRLYLGPWPGPLERPAQGYIDSAIIIADGLKDVGGPDVDWGLWSPTRNAFSKITAGWVDDEWDTVRSRGLRSTARTTFTTNE